MSGEANYNYPIVTQGNFDRLVGSVTVYTSEYPALGYPTWMMMPIIGHDIVRVGPQLKGFDLYNIIGKPCMLEVYHKPQKNKGGFWVEIQRIYTAPKGSTPPQFNETIKFSFEEYSPESFLNLPEYLQKKVMQAEEYRDLPQELKPILESDSNEIDPEEVIF